MHTSAQFLKGVPTVAKIKKRLETLEKEKKNLEFLLKTVQQLDEMRTTKRGRPRKNPGDPKGPYKKRRRA
jgi:hypothetical protein